MNNMWRLAKSVPSSLFQVIVDDSSHMHSAPLSQVPRHAFQLLAATPPVKYLDQNRSLCFYHNLSKALPLNKVHPAAIYPSWLWQSAALQLWPQFLQLRRALLLFRGFFLRSPVQQTRHCNMCKINGSFFLAIIYIYIFGIQFGEEPASWTHVGSYKMQNRYIGVVQYIYIYTEEKQIAWPNAWLSGRCELSPAVALSPVSAAPGNWKNWELE